MISDQIMFRRWECENGNKRKNHINIEFVFVFFLLVRRLETTFSLAPILVNCYEMRIECSIVVAVASLVCCIDIFVQLSVNSISYEIQ